MFNILFLLFIVIPLIELWLILNVGSLIGTAATIIIIIGTGVIGFTLVKISGLSIIMKMREKMLQGVMPTTEIVDGVLILCAGAVLLTPGFLTDFCGFLLLIPPTRVIVRKIILRKIKGKFTTQNIKYGADDE